MVAADDDHPTTFAEYDWLWQVRTGFLGFIDCYRTLPCVRVMQGEPTGVGDGNELFLFVDRGGTSEEVFIRNCSFQRN